jgi:hypothetical protein
MTACIGSDWHLALETRPPRSRDKTGRLDGEPRPSGASRVPAPGLAIEIAVLVGAASVEDEGKIVTLASRVVSMLTRLIR